MQVLELRPLIAKELGGRSRRGWTSLVRTVGVVPPAFRVDAVAGPAIPRGREIPPSESALLGRRRRSARGASRRVRRRALARGR